MGSGGLSHHPTRYFPTMAEATPEGYREKGRFSIPDQGFPSWAHPVVAQGCLFIRDQGMLSCYKITA